MIKLLKGFDYASVSLKKLQKDKFVLAPELEQQISRENLKAKLTSLLSDNGRAFFMVKKKEVCGVVAFRFEKHMASEFELLDDKKDDFSSKTMEEAVEIEEKTVVGGKKTLEKEKEKAMHANAFVLDTLYLTEALKSLEAQVKDDLIAEMKEVAAFSDLNVKVIIWEDEIIVDKTLGRTSESAIGIGMCLGIAIGMMFGTVFNNIGVGMCIGLGIGSCMGAAFYGTAKAKSKDDGEK